MKKKGFTLIEVVIVLAIGALIILVVLQAVSSARRSQRDNARKSQAGQISAALEQFASNNNGVYPTNANFAGFLTTYNPLNGITYNDVANCGATTTADNRSLEYVPGTGNRSYTLNVCLEVGGESQIAN